MRSYYLRNVMKFPYEYVRIATPIMSHHMVLNSIGHFGVDVVYLPSLLFELSTTALLCWLADILA